MRHATNDNTICDFGNPDRVHSTGRTHGGVKF